MMDCKGNQDIEEYEEYMHKTLLGNEITEELILTFSEPQNAKSMQRPNKIHLFVSFVSTYNVCIYLRRILIKLYYLILTKY